MDRDDSDLMRLALSEAAAAAEAGEVPVGAVIVKGDDVLASGQNRTIRDADPSGHAEIAAIRGACEAEHNHRLTDVTLYVTLEPCAMCVGAIAQARVGRVVFGAYDPKAGALGSVADLGDSALLNHRFETQGGLLADECGDILQAFFRARR